MGKVVFIFCIAIISILKVNGQATSSDFNKIVAPNSPTAASLSRYVDFPVTMSSGVPDVSIPLYEFKSSRISVPIGLSYHAGGIRVTDRTSTIGLGWSVIAGGAITRAVAGLPDDSPRGFFNMSYPDNLSENHSGIFYQYFTNDLGLRNISCFVNKVNNSLANNGANYDYSPDNYYYNAQGLSGQFTYGTDKILRTIPYDPIKIKDNIKTNPVNGNAPFIVTSSEGITYEFGGQFVLGKASAADNVGIPNSAEYATAWYLTKIISADKSDTVFFRYSTTTDNYLNTSISSTMRAGSAAFGFNFYAKLEPKVSKTQSSSMEYNVRLEEIKGKNGRVVFNYGEESTNSYRWDITTTLFQNTIRPLTSIEVYADKGSEMKIKQFNLQYSFFNSVPVKAPNSLRLDGVTEVGYSGGIPQSNPPYLFSYATNDVPPYNTNGRDLWGFYNAYKTIGDNDNLLLVDLPVPFFDENGGFNEPQNSFKKRAVNPSVLNKGMLKSIAYPTGGYTEFTFEPNGKNKLVTTSIPQFNNRTIRTMNFWPGSGMGGIDMTFSPHAQGFNRKLVFFGSLVTFAQSWLENDPQVILEDITNNEIIIDKTLSALASGAKTSEYFSINLPDIDPANTYRLYFPMPANQILQGQSVRYDLTATYSDELPSVQSTREEFIYAGGLRVKFIEHRDNLMSKFIKKQYNYKESYWNSDAFTGDFSSIKDAFGKRFYIPTGNAPLENAIVIPRPASYIYQESPTYSIGSPNSSVSYSKVEEVQVIDDDKFIGKTEFTFNTAVDMITTTGIERGLNWTEHLKVDRSFLRSQLLNKKVFKSQGNDWELIQETLNTYNNINDLPFNIKGSEYIKKYVTAYLYDDALHTEWAGSPPYPLGIAARDPLCPTYDAFTALSFNTMYINIVKPTLTSTITKEIGTSGNWVVNQTDYEYDNLTHMKPSEVITTKSDGSKVKQKIKYSSDIDIPYEGQGNAGWGNVAPREITANDPFFSGIINLQLANITTPIETSTFVIPKGSTDEKLLGSTFNKFHPVLPVIESISTIELNTPSESFLPANIFDQTIDYNTDELVLDPRYRKQVEFKYNVMGSLVQQQKTNNLFESILMGYKEQYPIAHVVGVEYDVVKNIIDPMVLTKTTTFSENALRVELNKLRTNIASKDGVVNTYTFSPLEGVTSQTDAAGRTSYFQYDPLGRLSVIRDQFDNIVKKNEYHYNPDKQIFTYVNRGQSVSFIKNNCSYGYVGVPVSFKVPGGKYYSAISQEDADQQALAEIALLGQAYANDHGTCSALPVYYNRQATMAFEKDDCPEGTAPFEDPFVYTVEAGKYSSLVSEFDADEQALSDLSVNGQILANQNCTCSAEPIKLQLLSGTDVDASLIIWNFNEEELEEIYFPENSSADPQTIELPATQDGYILRFAVPLLSPYTNIYSNGPYRFNIQSEGLVWRSMYYTDRANTKIFVQTGVLHLRPGRTYIIRADKTFN